MSTDDLVNCFERSEERWEDLGDSFRRDRRNSTPLRGVSSVWLETIFAMIYRAHRDASRAVLYKVFKREIERRLNRDADQYLEERLWSVIEAHISAEIGRK